jgi:hypothetical protein
VDQEQISRLTGNPGGRPPGFHDDEHEARPPLEETRS